MHFTSVRRYYTGLWRPQSRLECPFLMLRVVHYDCGCSFLGPATCSYQSLFLCQLALLSWLNSLFSMDADLIEISLCMTNKID